MGGLQVTAQVSSRRLLTSTDWSSITAALFAIVFNSQSFRINPGYRDRDVCTTDLRLSKVSATRLPEMIDLLLLANAPKRLHSLGLSKRVFGPSPQEVGASSSLFTCSTSLDYSKNSK